MDEVINQLDQIATDIEAIQNGLTSSILSNLEEIPGVKGIVDYLNNQLGHLVNGINEIGTRINTQIASGIQQAIPAIIADLHDAVTALSDGIAAILSNVATAEDVVTSAIHILKHHAPEFEGFLAKIAGPLFGSPMLGLLEFLEHQHPEAIDPMLDEMLKIPGIPAWLHSMVNGLRHRGAEWQALVLPIVLALMILPMGQALGEPFVSSVRQWAMEHEPHEIPTIPEIVEARLKGVLNDAQYHALIAKRGLDVNNAGLMLRSRFEMLQPADAIKLKFRGELNQHDFEVEMQQRGIDSQRATWLAESARPLLTEQEIREAFLRGIISATKHDTLLSQYGYSSEQIATRKSLYTLIPGPQDLIHMAIRNTFTPEIVNKFQLFSDFPDSFKQFAAQTGINEFWAQHYWGAHWVVPSNEEGFAMFHRTTDKSDDPSADTFRLSDGTTVKNIIGRSTLQLLLREKDTAPFYRDKITEIAYRPVTRIDLRRMLAQGVTTKAGVERGYLDLGYSPTNARRLSEFAERLATQEKKDLAAPLTTRLLERVIQLYVSDKIDRSDIAFALKDLGMSNAESDAWIADADILRRSQETQQIESGVGKLYVQGTLSAEEVRKELTAHRLPESAIETLLTKWNLEIRYKGATADTHTHKHLTKAELLEAFKDGLSTEDETRTGIIALGYSPHDAEIEVSLATFQKARTTRTTQIDAQKALYINGVQDSLTTSNALDALNVPSAMRDSLLAEWNLTKAQRVEKIPIATLRDMVRSQFMTQDDATVQLRRHRLSDTDISLLIRFWLEPKASAQGGTNGSTGA